MDISIFLAKVMGLYFVIVSLSLLINVDRFISTIANIMHHAAIQLVLGFNILIIGILLIVSHNIWQASWVSLVTLIGWIIFIKGILNIAFPKIANFLGKSFIKSKTICYISGLIDLVIGLVLCYYGFGVFVTP